MDLAVVRRLSETIGQGCSVTVLNSNEARRAPQWGRIGFALVMAAEEPFLALDMSVRTPHLRVGFDAYEVVLSPRNETPNEPARVTRRGRGRRPGVREPALDTGTVAALILGAVVVAAAFALGACTSADDAAAVDAAGPSFDAAAIDDTSPPVVDAELQAWLAAATYAGFLPESVAHPSAGQHGGTVRTFVNRALAVSLDAGNASHPVGAAAVKELHTGAGLRGWAVMVKTRADPGPASWYWYEVFSTTRGAPADYSGQANPTCTGCHGRGLDAVRTTWPLR